MPASKAILEKIIEQYLSSINNQNPSDFFIVTKIHMTAWESMQESRFSCADNKGFKYDLFHANYPGNPKTSKDPKDLNILSSALSSRGYEAYAFVYRDKKYLPTSATGSSKPA